MVLKRFLTIILLFLIPITLLGQKSIESLLLSKDGKWIDNDYYWYEFKSDHSGKGGLLEFHANNDSSYLKWYDIKWKPISSSKIIATQTNYEHESLADITFSLINDHSIKDESGHIYIFQPNRNNTEDVVSNFTKDEVNRIMKIINYPFDITLSIKEYSTNSFKQYLRENRLNFNSSTSQTDGICYIDLANDILINDEAFSASIGFWDNCIDTNFRSLRTITYISKKSFDDLDYIIKTEMLYNLIKATDFNEFKGSSEYCFKNREGRISLSIDKQKENDGSKKIKINVIYD